MPGRRQTQDLSFLEDDQAVLLIQQLCAIGNEASAALLVNATTLGDAGGRANHCTGVLVHQPPSGLALVYGAGPINTGMSAMAVGGVVATQGIYEPFTPTAAFRVEARVVNLGAVECDLIVRDGGTDEGASANGAMVALAPGTFLPTFTTLDNGFFTQHQSATTGPTVGEWCYLALARDGSGNWSAFWSPDRQNWQTIQPTFSKALTAAQLGVRGSVGAKYSVDFIDVVS